MIKLFLSLFIAFFLFGFTFLSNTTNFWIRMSSTGIFLTCWVHLFDSKDIKKIFALKTHSFFKNLIIGIISAAGLYLIFFIGNLLSPYIISSAATDISTIYQLKSGFPDWLVALTIALIIAPAEEIFWRNYIQDNLEKKIGLKGFFISIIAYTLVHLPTGNIMLMGAAMVCGLFWGFIYRRTQSLLTVIISHIVWDLSVFVFFPFS